MRHRTGLHNKYRGGGKSTYASDKKSRRADIYAKFNAGVPSDKDIIGGHAVWSVRNDTPRIEQPERRTTEPTTASHKRSRAGRVGKDTRADTRN